mmetsp:Transcript_6580/g.23282  ORF Transcript_6580/g.23282 Transcript_6580/m.23282 type:complete len:353 (+) Transcript_6580:120-1178(+)
MRDRSDLYLFATASRFTFSVWVIIPFSIVNGSSTTPTTPTRSHSLNLPLLLISLFASPSTSPSRFLSFLSSPASFSSVSAQGVGSRGPAGIKLLSSWSFSEERRFLLFSSSTFTTTRAPSCFSSCPTSITWSMSGDSTSVSSIGVGSTFSPFMRTIVSLARPVRKRQPVIGSILPRSPVLKNPSESNACLFASSCLWYPRVTCGPLAHTTPTSPLECAVVRCVQGSPPPPARPSSFPVSGSLMRISVLLAGLPQEPATLYSTILFAITGLVSVSPYPTIRLIPAASKKLSSAVGSLLPPEMRHLILPPRPSRTLDQMRRSPMAAKGARRKTVSMETSWSSSFLAGDRWRNAG